MKRPFPKTMNKKSPVLFSKFLRFISDKKMIPKGSKTLLALSGGVDSVVMVHLFSRAGIDFGIAHANFRLRGKESDADEEFACTLAARYGKTFHSKCFETNRFAKENKFSVQEAARELRYAWFNALSEEFDYGRVATAHHLDDSIETFFINLLRGTGPAGLRGIPAVHDKVIRPLLFATKDEVEAYARSNRLAFRTDVSNAGDAYLRNRIRHHLVPVLRENAESFESNMQRLMSEMAFLHAYGMEKVGKWRKKNVKTDPEGNQKIPLALLMKETQPIYFLGALLYSYGITGVECGKILAARNPGKIFMSRGYRILRDREFLYLQRRDQEKIETDVLIPVLPAQCTVGNKRISLYAEQAGKEKRVPPGKKVLHVSCEDLSFPLTLRRWLPGDAFVPLGMKGRKKVSDYFTDIKLNRFEKDNALLLLSGKNIVCILGHRIDDRYKITAATRKILTVELSVK